MSRSATFAILVIIILAASAVFALGNGMGKDTSEDPPSEPESPVEPGPTGMLVEGLPDGYSADVQTYTIIAPSETDWLVIDRLHTFYDTNRFGGFTERYEGDEVRSDSITLGVGSYTVVSGGCEFSVVVYGVIERTASWTYDMGGRTMDVSVTYTMDIQDLMESVESSREFNATHNGGKSAEFIHLPEIVVRDDLTDRLEDALDSEFRRVGGNPSDAQSKVRIIFLNLGEKEAAVSMGYLQQLRKAGIACEIYPDALKLKKQFDYADRKSVPFISITGGDEVQQGLVNIKNLSSGEQKSFGKDDIEGMLGFISGMPV